MLTALATLVALATPAHADPTATTCYTDADGDGYYDASTASWARSLLEDWPAGTHTCAAYGAAEARFKFDCDDSDDSVHPRTRERANGVDDNCNGKVDEPTFYWPRQSSTTQHTDTSIRFYTYVNDDAVWEAGDRTYLAARIHYRPVTESQWSSRFQAAYDVDSAHPSRWFTVSNLEPGTVYAFRVQFYEWTGGAWQAVGDESDHLFSMTTDASDTLPGTTRTDIVLDALYNYERSNRGYLGYQGTTTVDGTADTALDAFIEGYGAAESETGMDGKEQWCTETYVGHTMDYVDPSYGYTIPDDGDNSGTARIGTIGELADAWFNNPSHPWAGSAYFGSGCDNTTCGDAQQGQLALAWLGRPGDWVHLGEHSTMLLGYDNATGKVWVVDGNGSFPSTDVGDLTAPPASGADDWTMASNVISVRAFNLSQVRGTGLLQPEMF